MGPVDPVSKNVFVATGFRKWGLALGIAASELLVAWVDGRDHPWRELFDTRRVRLRASAGSLLKENANVALRFFGDRVVRRADVESIQGRGGAVVGAGLGQRAVYRDEQGILHSLSARCTHLGCIVNWNSGEGTWDCPCHGSRFSARGEVIMGPAVHGARGARAAELALLGPHPIELALALADLALLLAHDPAGLSLGDLGVAQRLARGLEGRQRRGVLGDGGLVRLPGLGELALGLREPGSRAAASRAAAGSSRGATARGVPGLGGAGLRAPAALSWLRAQRA